MGLQDSHSDHHHHLLVPVQNTLNSNTKNYYYYTFSVQSVRQDSLSQETGLSCLMSERAVPQDCRVSTSPGMAVPNDTW